MTADTKDATTNAAHPKTLLGGTAIKPVERKGFEAIRYFIHNPETGEFFTRTPKSWALIFIFYCIYYTLLAAFWYGMLMAFFTTLPVDRPRWTLDDSLIGSNPGLGIRPVQTDARIDSSIVKLVYNAAGENPSPDFETESNVDWAKRLEVFMNGYDNTTATRDCPDGALNDQPEACRFDKTALGPCSQFPYGYESVNGENVKPCVVMKPNRLFDWAPEPFEDGEVDEVEGMPDRIKEALKANPNKLYVDCAGENPFDREGLEGKLTYFPADQGIDFKFFPYTQVNGNYHNPIVAVKFGDIELGRLYHVECLLWGKGIKHDRKQRAGLVRFDLLIE